MTRYVVDASVAVKWFLPDVVDEANTLEALGLLLRLRASEVLFVQPAHWKAEVGSVLARRVPAQATAFLDDLNLLEGISIVDTPLIYHRGMQLSIELGHHLFDTLYHATALESDAVMITADRRYYDKAASLGRILILLLCGGHYRITENPAEAFSGVIVLGIDRLRRNSWRARTMIEAHLHNS